MVVDTEGGRGLSEGPSHKGGGATIEYVRHGNVLWLLLHNISRMPREEAFPGERRGIRCKVMRWEVCLCVY